MEKPREEEAVHTKGWYVFLLHVAYNPSIVPRPLPVFNVMREKCV